MVTLEWIALVVLAGLVVLLTVDAGRCVAGFGPSALPALLGLPAGLVAATLFTGFGHFLADNFMKIDTPIFGHALVFRFRQHHEDPTIICGLTFRELNGGIALSMLIFALPVALLVPVSTTVWGAFLGLGAASMAVFGAATNQIHRWTHEAQPAGWVRLLQRTGLVLTRRHHAQHHVAPHATHYCITNGWFNGVLDRLRIWHHLADVLAATGLHQAPESVMGWRAQARHAAAERRAAG